MAKGIQSGGPCCFRCEKDGMSDTLRSSGIPFVDEVPWGTHLCLFYETQDDLIDAATPFFEHGLDRNELCVWAIPDGLAISALEARLRPEIIGFDDHVTAGRLRFVAADWHDGNASPDFERATAFWAGVLADAINGGYDGLRASGEALWLSDRRRDDVRRHERQILHLLTGQPALALCTYDLSASRGIDVLDVLDVTRLHSVAVARRRGEWQLFEAPPLRASAAIDGEAFGRSVAAFPGQLTEREQAVLARLLEGASAKEMARDLGISPRTAEFHRANIIGKLGAKNTADLIRRVLGRR